MASTPATVTPKPFIGKQVTQIKAKKDALWKPLLRRFRKFIQDAVST